MKKRKYPRIDTCGMSSNEGTAGTLGVATRSAVARAARHGAERWPVCRYSWGEIEGGQG